MKVISIRECILRIVKPQCIAGSLKASSFLASMIVMYFVTLIVLLGIAEGNACGIAGRGGWA